MVLSDAMTDEFELPWAGLDDILIGDELSFTAEIVAYLSEI